MKEISHLFLPPSANTYHLPSYAGVRAPAIRMVCLPCPFFIWFEDFFYEVENQDTY